MARPKLDIDGDLVTKFASLGCKTQEIADYFGCNVGTITGRFSEELIKGRADLKMSLRQWQLAAAKKGNATLLIWLGKQLLGQKDNDPQDFGVNKEQLKTIFQEALESRAARKPD